MNYTVTGYILQKEEDPDLDPLYNVFGNLPFSRNFRYPRTFIIPDSEWLIRNSRVKTFAESKFYHLMLEGGEGEIVWYVDPGSDELSQVYQESWGQGPVMLGDWQGYETPYLHCSVDKEGMWGLEFPPVVAYNYGLREGDEVELQIDLYEGRIRIISVNTETSPSIVRSWKRDLDEFEPDLPDEQIPLGQYGPLSMRLAELWGPVGWGHNVWNIGQGWVGKTTLTLDFVRTVGDIAEDRGDTYIVATIIGEHREDSARYKRVLADFEGFSEFHHSPRGVTESVNPNDSHVRVTEFVAKRVYRLMATGLPIYRNVVLVLDGIGRVFQALSGARPTEVSQRFKIMTRDAGMLSYGHKRGATDYLTQVLLATRGNYGDRTLTTFYTALRDHSSEGVLVDEAGRSTPTVAWELIQAVGLRDYHPPFNIHTTRSRNDPHRDTNSPFPWHVVEMLAFQHRIRLPVPYVDGKGKWQSREPDDEEIFKASYKYAQDNPVPWYVKPPDKPREHIRQLLRS